MKTVSVIKRIHFYLLIIPIRVSLNIYLGFVNMTHNSDSSIDSRLGTRSPWRSRIEIFDHIMVKFGPSYNNRQITHGWNELLIRFVVSLNIFKISQTLKSQFNEVRWPIFQLLLGYANVDDMLKVLVTDIAVFSSTPYMIYGLYSNFERDMYPFNIQILNFNEMIHSR